MMEFLRPSFNFESLNPFRRQENNKNFYVEIRKFVLKNSQGSVRGRLNVSGPTEIIGIFAQHVIKLCKKANSDHNELKKLIIVNKELPSLKKVIK